jgi:hypothetical protein
MTTVQQQVAEKFLDALARNENFHGDASGQLSGIEH